MTEIDHFVSNGSHEDRAVQSLQELFERAAQTGVSDVELAHDMSKVLQIRLYKDTDWISYREVKGKDADTMEMKLRGRCNVAITDKQVPRDGNFTQKAADRHFDVRVNFLPTLNGTSIVCRLLDSQKGGLPIERLGMPPAVQKTFRDLLTRREGAIFAVGPTGSGKTTTLYAGVSHLNQPNRKCITIEDPVEYRIPGLAQVQVGDGTGRTFATALRASMRQRPDLIVTGEIRDAETARVAMLAGQSGHLLLSSFHANSSVLAPLTLEQHGIDPYRIGATVLAFIAQRRVKKICGSCATVRAPNPQEIRIFRHHGLDPSAAAVNDSPGCASCSQTGFAGMITLWEMLRISDYPDAVEHVADRIKLAEVARNQPQYRTLAQEAARYIYEGITSVAACSSLLWSTDDHTALEQGI